MKNIQLSQAKQAIVDDEDFEKVNQYRWYLNSNGYARRTHPKTYMHQFILDIQKGKTVDHINGEKLDNRRENLRICTALQNSYNHSVNKNNTSGFKGVGWHNQMKKWRAYIDFNNHNRHLGLFNNKIDAALAYNKAAIELFGEFAKLNIL